jgi:hypothetical protein
MLCCCAPTPSTHARLAAARNTVRLIAHLKRNFLAELTCASQREISVHLGTPRVRPLLRFRRLIRTWSSHCPIGWPHWCYRTRRSSTLSCSAPVPKLFSKRRAIRDISAQRLVSSACYTRGVRVWPSQPQAPGCGQRYDRENLASEHLDLTPGVTFALQNASEILVPVRRQSNVSLVLGDWTWRIALFTG